MTAIPRLPLRPILLVDAAACLAMGVGLVALAGILEPLTAIPAGVSLGAGLLLLPVAAFILLVATRPAVPPAGVAVIVAGNAAWVAASLALAAGGWIEPNGLGVTLILGQAAAVAVVAALEHAARPAGGAARAAV